MWLYVAQDRKQRQAVVSTVTNSEEFVDRISNEILKKHCCVGFARFLLARLVLIIHERPSHPKQRGQNLVVFLTCSCAEPPLMT